MSRRATFSRPAWSRPAAFMAALVMLAFAADCSRQPPADSALDAETLPAADDASELAAGVEASPVVDPAIAKARRAFERMTSENVTPTEWEAASQELLELGGGVTPVLAEGLASAEIRNRETAATVLAMLGPEAAGAESALMAALQDESAFVRANAATALCLLPDHEQDVIPVLAALLSSDDPQLRQTAAMNLQNFGPEAAPFVAQLAAVLDHGAEDVVVPVVELLGRIGPQARSAKPKLQQIAFEQSGEPRQAATTALELIGDTPQQP